METQVAGVRFVQIGQTVMSTQTLGPYRIERLLGHGGMGSVYQGVHKQTGQRAAIKVLAENLCADPRFRERFRCEIETLQRLHHENIVQLHGFGEEQNRLFFVMELVEGPSLDAPLRSGNRFSWTRVVDVAIQVCAALKHAHDHGVIHRDLKPANLLQASGGRIKLTDFGIARLFGVTGLTLAGNMVGTPDYMAPEQTEGQRATPRSDLYSLGCVMYALLSGKPPFSAKSMTEVLIRVRSEEAVPLRQVAPNVPVELEQIVRQLLYKEPSRRIPTPQALSKLLRAMAHALPEAWSAAEDSTPVVQTPRNDGSSARGSEGVPGTAERPTLDFTPEDAKRAASYKTDFRVTQPQPPTPAPATAPPGSPSLSETRPPAHFTQVDPEVGLPSRLAAAQEVTPAQRRQERLRVIGLGTLLLAVVAAIVWALIPVSADQQFARIQNWSQQSDPPPLRYHRAMQEFLERFPDDPRVAEVERLAEHLAREELREELQTKLRGLTDAETRFLQALEHADRGESDEAEALLEQIVTELADRDTGALGVTERRLLQRSRYLLEQAERP